MLSRGATAAAAAAAVVDAFTAHCASSDTELASMMSKSDSTEKLALALPLPVQVTDAIRKAADGRQAKSRPALSRIHSLSTRHFSSTPQIWRSRVFRGRVQQRHCRRAQALAAEAQVL